MHFNFITNQIFYRILLKFRIKCDKKGYEYNLQNEIGTLFKIFTQKMDLNRYFTKSLCVTAKNFLQTLRLRF